MSSENEDQCLSVKSEFDEAKQKRSNVTYTIDFPSSFTEMDICKDLPSGVDLSNIWQSKISYARDFLLSFSELEVCRRLPGGFNPSMLCESLDAFSSIFDMEKTAGGKEDIHSSGQNNRDCHSQGNWVSDSGNGHGGHSQYSRQNIVFVYNGLSGSGTSSKVSQGTAGAMAPKVQANGNYQLSKSDNPYRPPHSSKVVPKAVRKIDSYRKRTSSSAECMNMERAEEEKAGGSSFDLNRKKEQRAIQDKQKQIGDKHGMLLSQDSPNDVRLVNKSEECMISSYLNENSAKSSTPAQNSVSRQCLRNADFTSKNLGIKSLPYPCKFKPRESCDVEANKNHRPVFHTKNFADWFVEEGKKKVGGCSSLSTKGSSEVFRTSNRLTEHNIATFSSYRNALMCKLTTSTLPSAEHRASEPTESREVLTCEELKQSTLSDNNKNTATRHHFALGLGAHDIGNQELHSENEDGASLYFSSLSQKAVTSSKHKMSSLHENFLPVESDCSVANILTKGNSKTHKKSQTFEPNFGIGYAKDFESDEMPLPFLRDSLDGVSGPVVSNPGGLPSSVADDNFLTSIADAYQFIGTNFEGSRAANLAEITDLANTKVNQSTFDDDWAEILSMLIMEQESNLSAMYSVCCQMSDSTVQIQLPDEDSLIAIDDLLTPRQLAKSIPETAPKHQREQESKLIPIAGCNESALEYCLPDEESLITFDDLIIPQQLVSMSAVSSGKDRMLPSNIAVYNSGKLPAQNVVKQNERSAVPGCYGAMNLGNSYHSQCTQQSYPQFCCSLINPGKPSLDALESHEAQMNTQTKSMNPRTTSSTLPHKEHFKVQSLASGRTTKPKRPLPLVCYSLLQQPAVFLPCQQNVPVRGPTLTTYMTQMSSHAQGLNPMQILPPNYLQASYEGFRMPNPGRAVSPRDGYEDL